MQAHRLRLLVMYTVFRRNNGKCSAVRANNPVEPFTVLERYVSRNEELLHDSSGKTATVHGLGGIDKTHLASTYAQRPEEEYSAVL